MMNKTEIFKFVAIGMVIGSGITGYSNYLAAADAMENSSVNGNWLMFSEDRIYTCERVNLTKVYEDLYKNNTILNITEGLK